MKKLILFTIIAMVLSSCSQEPKTVLFNTSMGEIEVLLYDETPQHRDNFVKLVEDNYFDGTLFHRVIKDFMIQAGDPDSKGAPAGKMLGMGGPDYTVPAEIKMPALFHKRGALAAARQGDAMNPTKASSGSQFYIVWGRTYSDAEMDNMGVKENREVYKAVGGTPFLDGQYTVFGEITKGLDIVEKIQTVETNPYDRPTQDIIINSAEIK